MLTEVLLPEDIELLSKSAVKQRLFCGDPFFRDGMDWLSMLSSRERSGFLSRCAPLIVRPDAFVAGIGPALLDYLDEHGFEPLWARSFTFDRRLVREMWRYQLNIATRDRIDVMDLILLAGPSLYLLLWSDEECDVPATVALRELKGPSSPSRRRLGQMRSLSTGGQASVLTYVHTCDEPADIVRELSVLWPRSVVKELLRSPTGRGRAQADAARAAVLQTSRAYEPSSLRLEQAASELGIDLTAGPDWREIVERYRYPCWQAIAIAAHLAETHIENGECTIPDGSSADWRS